MRINIALIIGQLSLGGSEKQLYLLARFLQNSGRYNVFVIVLSSVTEPYGSILEKEGVSVISLIRELPYFDIFRIISLRKLIINKQINIIYSFSLTANFYSYFALLFNHSIKFISGSRSIEKNRSKFLKIIDDFIIRHSGALITNSRENLRYLKKLSSDSSRINGYVIRNGIERLPHNNPNKPDKNGITIGTIALFKEVKNYSLFIDLCKAITDQYDKVNFIAIGAGPELDKMISYARSVKCKSKLEFMGDRSNATEIMLSEFDIFVLTSKREGLPNAIMEAMLLGIPVVATDVGGVSELIQHSVNGFLVPSEDLDGLTKYCMLLIENPDLRIKIGQNGKDFITRNYSAEKMMNEFEKVFKSLEVNIDV